MSAKDFNLPISSRSGHPIYPLGNLNPASSTTLPGKEAINPLPDVEITPKGTWKSVTAGPGPATIERLDLSGRYSYDHNASKIVRSRPKNALKKGLRPTKSFELPSTSKTDNDMAATRKIYRPYSSSANDEDGNHSEPSPSKPQKKLTATSELPLKTMPTHTKPMVQKRQIHEISSDDEDGDDRTLYEAPPSRSKVPRLTTTTITSHGANQKELPAHNNDPFPKTPTKETLISSPGTFIG
ncbi:MAG: hypothetical protein Q9172_007426, partial [Xanthocarpia lactea]